MAVPEVSRMVAINEALIDLSQTVNGQYALRLTLQTGMASNEHMARIYEEITSFEQWHLARVSFRLEHFRARTRVNIDSLGTEEEALSLSSPSTQQHNINGSEFECECESGQPVEAANPKNSEMGEDEQPENAVKLECEHVFGERRIRRWINEGNPPTCPTCKRVLNGSKRGEGDALILQVEYLE